MKNLLTVLLIALSFFQSFAQDIIVKNDKTEIKAKIEELTETTIKYKKFEMLDGPSYNISKRDVFMVIYKNGTKEYIESTVSQPVIANKQPMQENKQPAPNQAKVSSGNTVSQNNTNYSNADFIDQKGNKYYYKGEMIRSFRQMTSIFEENHAQESINYMSKRRTQYGVGAALVGVGIIGQLVFGRRNSTMYNPAVNLASGGIMIVGGVFFLISGSQTKKAVTSYNSTIKNGGKVSFVPTFNSDKLGNHIGIAMRF